MEWRSADEDHAPARSPGGVLAVDLGLRLGLALWDDQGALHWARSQHFGSRDAMRRGAWAIIRDAGPLTALALEGDRALGEVWERAARKQWPQVIVLKTGARGWREAMMTPSQLSLTSAKLKALAGQLAREAWRDHGASKGPTALRHDAAEAVLLGLWALRQLAIAPQDQLTHTEGERM